MTLRERRVMMVECERYYRSHSVLWPVSLEWWQLLRCIKEALPAWMRRMLGCERTGR